MVTCLSRTPSVVSSLACEAPCRSCHTGKPGRNVLVSIQVLLKTFHCFTGSVCSHDRKGAVITWGGFKDIFQKRCVIVNGYIPSNRWRLEVTWCISVPRHLVMDAFLFYVSQEQRSPSPLLASPLIQFGHMQCLAQGTDYSKQLLEASRWSSDFP